MHMDRWTNWYKYLFGWNTMFVMQNNIGAGKTIRIDENYIFMTSSAWFVNGGIPTRLK